MKRTILAAVLVSSLVSVAATLAAVAGVNPAGAAAQAGKGGGPTGAWVVAATRPTGEGVVLLTFDSDGTFFRSGDTHPVLSVAHGVWTQIGNGEYEGSYVALRFDENRNHVGSQNTRIHISVGSNPDEFTGLARVRTLALDGSVQTTSETQLHGTRMTVEPFGN